MSTGPFIPQRAGQPFDLLENSVIGGGWEGLEELMRPHLQTAPLQPSDQVALALYVMYALGGEGRAVIEWLMDITLRAPLRVTGASLEETALRAAQRQGINGVGEVVLNAITHGEKLFKQSQNGAGA